MRLHKRSLTGPAWGVPGRSGGRVGSWRLVAEGVQEHPGSQASCQDADPFVVPPVGMGSGFPGPPYGPMWAYPTTLRGMGRLALRADCLVSSCGGFPDPSGETGSCWPGHRGSRALGTRGGFAPGHGKPAAPAVCPLRPASPVPSLSAQT